MKIFKLLTFVLVLTMLMSCVVAGYATANTYTEAEILAGTVKDAGYDFTRMTAEKIQAYGTSGKNASTVQEDGLKLVVGNETKNNGAQNLGYGYINLGLTYSSTATKAVKITFVAPQAGSTIETDFRDGSERFRIFTNASNQIGYHPTNLSGGYVMTPGETYTVIGAKDSNGKMVLYVKGGNEINYTKVVSGVDVVTGSFSNLFQLYVIGQPGATAIFKDVTLYGAGYEEDELLPGLFSNESLDFVQMNAGELSASVQSGATLSVTPDNGANFAVIKGTSGYANLNGLTYSETATKAVKISFVAPENDTRLEVSLFNNNKRLRLYTYANASDEFEENVIACGKNGFSSYPVIPGEVYTIIAIENVEDKITVYAKAASEYAYKEILTNVDVLTGTNWPDCNKIEVVGAVGDSVVVEEISYYVEGGVKSDVLGTANAALHYFDFDAAYDGLANVDYTSADGLTASKKVWKSQGSKNTGLYIPDGGAAAVRFKTNNSYFEAYIGGEEGRAILLVSAAGVAKLKVESNTQLEIGTIEQNVWHTFIIKDNGSGYDVYVAKNETAGFVRKLSTSKKENNATVRYTELCVTDNTYVDYFAIYGASANDVPVNTGMTLLHNADFANDADFLGDAQAVSVKNATVSNGAMVLSNGQYYYNDTGIPAGGYVEYMISGNAITSVFVQGGTDMELICQATGIDGLANGIGNMSVSPEVDGGSWVSPVNVSHTPNVKYVYRIGRTLDDKYSVWRKVEGTEGWLKIFDKITVRTKQSIDNYGLVGTGTVDYVKIYAPATAGVVMTDGDNTTLFVDGTAPLKYANELRVIANSNQNGVLVLGLYDGTELESAIIEKVAAGVEKVAVKDVSAAKKVKVFFWDGFTTMNRLYDASPELTVSAE